MSALAGRRPSLRAIATTMLAFGAAAALMSTPAGAESAPSLFAHQDGVCTGGKVCLAAQTIGNQSRSDFAFNDPDLNDNVYLSAGVNQGLVVGNTARWVFNNDATRFVVLCTDVNYGGNCTSIAPNSGGTLAFPYRANIESLYFS